MQLRGRHISRAQKSPKTSSSYDKWSSTREEMATRTQMRASLRASAFVAPCIESAPDIPTAIALKSIDAVREISRTVRDPAALTFCGTLRAVLGTIKTHVELKADEEEDQAGRYKKYLDGFLNNLERLCAVS